MKRNDWRKQGPEVTNIKAAIHLLPGMPPREGCDVDVRDPLQNCCMSIHETMTALGVRSQLMVPSGLQETAAVQYHAHPELAQMSRWYRGFAGTDFSDAVVFAYDPGSIAPAAMTNAAAVVYVANTLPNFDRSAGVVAHFMRMADAIVYPHRVLRDAMEESAIDGPISLVARFPHTSRAVNPASPGTQPRGIDVLWVGRDVPRKRLPTLLSYVRGSHLRTVVVGNLSHENVEKAKHVRDVECHSGSMSASTLAENYYAKARFLVHTADLESSPRVIIEALTNGCQVVLPSATRNGWHGAWVGTPGVHFSDLITATELNGIPESPAFDRVLAGLSYAPKSRETLTEWAAVCASLGLPMY